MKRRAKFTSKCREEIFSPGMSAEGGLCSLVSLNLHEPLNFHMAAPPVSMRCAFDISILRNEEVVNAHISASIL